jgi:large subunit ribosomal protein L10
LTHNNSLPEKEGGLSLNRREKEILVADMKNRLQKSLATFIVDYQGLDVEAMNSLRKELKKSDTEFQVVKNRLLKLASQDTHNASVEEYFEGPCALAINYEDAVTPAKVLIDQSKVSKNLTIKAGQIAGKAMDLEGIKKLAELPSRDVLLAQVLSAMQAVPTSLVRALSGVIVNMLNVLKAIESQKTEKG